MNNITRQLVNPSVLIALAVFSANAEPLGILAGKDNTAAVQPAVTSGDSLGITSDVTTSSFSESASFTMHDGFVGADNGLSHSAAGLKSSNGKVLTTESISASNHSPAETTTSDLSSADSADQVIAEASASVSEVVDPSNMSIATTAAPQPATTDAAASTMNFNADPTSVSPEPSTLLLVGSIFAGFGMFRRKRNS